jgi:chemotaxis protein MotB
MGVAALVLSTNTGCYYDQLLQEQRARRVVEEQLARAQQDLHDAQSMNQVLNSKIESLNGQLTSKQQLVDSLTAENESLRDKWGKAMAALEEMAKKDMGKPIVVTQVLPPELDEALKAFAAAHPELLEYLPEKGAIRWKADLLFPLGSDDLGDAVAGPLREFAEIVNSAKAAGFDVIVVGHTCNTRIAKPETLREHKTNWHLSAHRAISVMKALAGFGVSETKMGVMGYGEWRPIVANTTTENKAKNRRVEIFLWKADKASTGGGETMEASPTPKAAPKAAPKAKKADAEKKAEPAPAPAAADAAPATPAQ